ncbi:hypothetical protein VHEMI06002 [[Torrubiella] hemipterigena]|uniref:Uncharacterized protein n=1 Tax=[Torrubiella] hemipterigena TaxID=1531966 RepID=A0A0A1TIF7_9HYPO|nr:hypothetical protein VHEMI06002 [[Torrubiella] hemipterigena]
METKKPQESPPHAWPAMDQELFHTSNDQTQWDQAAEQNEATGQEEHHEEDADFYKVVTTALSFVAFLFSLVVVEIKYSLRRTRMHAADRGIWIPWLTPYRPRTRDSQWHYQRVQSDLLKMETADAFDMRGAMAGVVVVVLVGALASVLFGARFALSWWYSQI